MKFTMLAFLVGISGLIFNPVFVYAGTNCYVDEDADSGGDGSKEDPYTKISKALEKGCSKIEIGNGKYKDNIVIGKGVKLKGSDRKKVIITGKITMKNGSEIEKISVDGGGVSIAKNANAKINNVIIKNSGTGIETSGDGKLTVKKSKILGNRKGFYLQLGKNISITSSVVSNNSEEGIDIRSNVDGIISGNTIERNGESGIELILGKSDLTISNNKIKNNKSSGIASQFYSHADRLGSVKITGNTITGNSDFAVNCKAPSGGNPSVGYWANSMSLIGNDIHGNKDGNFSPNCGFKNLKITNATKTEEELETEKLVRVEALEKLKEDSGEVIGNIKILQTNSGYLNLRVSPLMGSKIIGRVESGEEYSYNNQSDGWYKVVVDDNLVGWIASNFTEKIEDLEKEELCKEVIVEILEEQSIINERDKLKISNDILIIGGSVVVAIISILIYLVSQKYFKRKNDNIINN